MFGWRQRGGFETAVILDAWKYLPPNVLRPERNKRQHLSHVLSRNEVQRDYAYNRRLFVRLAQGWYQFNPALSVRRREGGGAGGADGGGDGGEKWLPIWDALNLRFAGESADPDHWLHVNTLLVMAGQEPMGTPIGGEAEAREMAVRNARLNTPMPAPAPQPAAASPAWGTPAAKRTELERVRLAIAEKMALRMGKNGDES